MTAIIQGIPQALRTQSTLPRTDHFTQLWRYGLVDDTRLDQLLDRLAGATAHHSLPTGIYGASDHDPLVNGTAYRNTIKAATAFTHVDFAWVPLDETPSTMERNSDVTLHLAATLASADLNDPATHWSIHSLGRPEAGARAASTVPAGTGTNAGGAPSDACQTVRRKVRQLALVGSVSREILWPTFANSVDLLRAMMYRPHFAVAKHGYAFAMPTCWIYVFKLFNVPEDATILDLSTLSPIAACADSYMIEIVSKPPHPQAPAQHYIAHAEAEMMLVSQWIRGLGDTGVPDLSAFREKIPYKNK